MARAGITYAEVAEAATVLLGQGRNPTVEQVRLVLGTGSSTTIANHLRQWKSYQESNTLISSKENLPQEFVAMMKGLWERVIHHSQDQVASIEAGYQQTISELRQEVEKYKTNNHRWQKLFYRWVAEKNQMTSDNLTLEQALEFAHKENVLLHAKQDALFQQLQDRDVRIDELHHLHKQAQENLEQYRDSVRDQRLLDQQQFEQQKQQLQYEIKSLNDISVVQREKILELQHRDKILQQSNSRLEDKNAELCALLQQVTAQLENAEKSKIELTHSNQQLHAQYQISQKELKQELDQLTSIQVDVKLLSQKFAETKQSLLTLEEQNKLLIHEKWMIGQEKAQLEGQLSILQKTIIA